MTERQASTAERRERPPRPPRRAARWLVALALVAALVATIAAVATAQQGRRSRDAEPGAQHAGIPVLVAEAKSEDVPVYLDGVGTAQAFKTVTVRSQVDGKLASVDFEEGQEVTKGDVLARIDPVTYQAQLDQARAKLVQDQSLLANARVDLERYTRLAKTDYATKQQADTQQATVAQLQAQIAWDEAAVESAKAYVDYCTITSPIDGRTGFRQVDAGNIIHASDATGIVVITQLRPISVVFTLPETDLGRVNEGMAKGAAHGPGDAGRQHGAGRGGKARRGRQPGRRDDRHDPPQGDLPEHRACSSGRASSSTSSCWSRRATTRSSCRRRRSSRGRMGPTSSSSRTARSACRRSRSPRRMPTAR